MFLVVKHQPSLTTSSVGVGSMMNRFSFSRYDNFLFKCSLFHCILLFIILSPSSLSMFLTEIGMKWHEQKILLCWLPICSFCPHKNTPTTIINHCPQSGTCVTWFLVPCKCWRNYSKLGHTFPKQPALELQNLYQSFKKCSFYHDPEASTWACGDHGCNSVNSTAQISAVDFDRVTSCYHGTVWYMVPWYIWLLTGLYKIIPGAQMDHVCHFSFQFMFNCFYMHLFGAILQ